MVSDTVIGTAQLAVEPAARSSNLLPVKANEIRFLSVLSSNTSGMLNLEFQCRLVLVSTRFDAAETVYLSVSCEPMKQI